MNVIVIYDSMFGNTKKVAEAIAEGLKKKSKVILSPVAGMQGTGLEGVELLVLGTPVHGGRPTPAIESFIDGIEIERLRGLKVAVFDTRFEMTKQNFAMKLLLKTVGNAAPKMAEKLKQVGANLIALPEGFIVTGKEGPLKEGEVERARIWAEGLLK